MKIFGNIKLLLLLFGICWCRIYRLRECNKFGGTFSIIFQNKLLQKGDPVKTFNGITIDACLGSCVDNKLCKSISFSDANGQCYLHSTEFTDYPGQTADEVLTEQPGWVYMQSDEDPQNNLHACARNPCAIGVCVETCGKRGYRCECPPNVIDPQCETYITTATASTTSTAIPPNSTSDSATLTSASAIITTTLTSTTSSTTTTTAATPAPASYTCDWVNNEVGTSESQEQTTLENREDCLNHCIAQKSTNAAINGVTFGQKNCICEINMTGSSSNNGWKFCELVSSED